MQWIMCYANPPRFPMSSSSDLYPTEREIFVNEPRCSFF